ncbi:hypothetical protein FWK45_04025 [Histophilus somni]|uniref:Uncharacterized protein n=1 Tax=Histophilus somni TaxID=731 RepID=A0A9Q6K8L1_HISSO|nr:Imm42 family immunity protein [Histophilus somni]ARU64628.1 hypothetical protein BTV18_03510 [Histophilus somni]ARU66494.1 hypothetical protein BTV19_03945 [Histophilus somni]ARU68368.1 hypothetical protein BTV16_03945 [Histophilus somni]ARU70246.1 hypothetical protein BTV20_03950 [Histophilus somni]ARU72122.1 hypothetical protein BTV17_03940 [Histophilus somni]
MIVGNPFEFAIRYDVVKEWNHPDSNWINGIYEIYIQSSKYPKGTHITELKTNLLYLFTDFERKMRPISEQELEKLSELVNIDDRYYNDLISRGAFLNLESSEMNDEGISILFCFNEKGDYLILYEKDIVKINCFEKGHIFKVLAMLKVEKHIDLIR